jgi:glycosyltransferase involved in cell wall biosynthesis
MKIALCGRFNTKIRHQGGSAEVFLSLAKELAKKHDLILFGRGNPTPDIKDMCRELHLNYYSIPGDSVFDIILSPISSILLLARNLGKAEIIHSHTGCFAFASIFFKKNRKIITNIHEFLITQERPLREKIYALIENFMLLLGAKKSDLTIVPTNYMRKLIAQKNINNIIVIPHWIDSKLFKPKKNIEVNKIYKKNIVKLLFVGRLVKRKGILELIESLNYIDDIKSQLLIIGIGDLYSEIEEIERKNDRVKLIGFVKHGELPKYYSAANLTILPSYFESFGLVPLESLSCGTPVLVANNSGLKEIISPCIGFLINKIDPKIIADSIREALSNIKKSKIQYRKYVVDNFNFTNIMNKYEIEYKKLSN